MNSADTKGVLFVGYSGVCCCSMYWRMIAIGAPPHDAAGKVFRPNLNNTDYSLTQIVYDREERSQLAIKQGKFAEDTL